MASHTKRHFCLPWQSVCEQCEGPSVASSAKLPFLSIQSHTISVFSKDKNVYFPYFTPLMNNFSPYLNRFYISMTRFFGYFVVEIKKIKPPDQ